MAVMDRDRWRRLEPLLDQALDLPDAERDRWLAELGESAPDLADDLRALLAGDANAERQGFLERGGPSRLVTLAGVALGPWTLERPVGHGGMGSVWLARRSDGRFVGAAAVKLLNLSLLDDASQRRFRREGSALARLAHPGIARLLDAGMSPSGQPYLVLEYVDGRHIDEWVAARALDAEACVRLVLQVLDAVEHAHANLIVHRDLKPSNILVTDDGRVKLLDFGIARMLDADGSADTAVTLEGARALTPEYAAPEQVRGDAITTATDVYASGVLLYVLLSGRHPTAPAGRAPAELLRALMEVEPPRLGLGDLDTVLERALRKAPAERYQTAAAFAQDLERWLRHEPVSARPRTAAYLVGRFLRRHRATVAAGLVAATTLVGATAFSVGQMREAQRQRDAALDARRRADAQAELQQVLMSQLGDRPMTMRELLDRGRVALERQYGADARVMPGILLQLAARYAELDDRGTRHVLLVRAESLATASGQVAALAESRCGLADDLRTQGRYAEARALHDAALVVLARAPDPDVESRCLAMRAELETETGNPDVGGPAVRRALAIRDSLGDSTSSTYVGLLTTLAYSLNREKRPREALATYRRSLAMIDAGGRSGTMMQVITQHDYALQLDALGETAEAERILHGLLAQLQAGDPGGDLPVQPLIHYGHAALFAGHLDSARRYLGVLVGQAEREGNPYWTGRGLFALARTEIAAGRLAQARRTTERFRAVSALPNLRNTDDEVTDVRVLDARLALAGGDAARAHALVMDALRAHGLVERPGRTVLRPSLLLASETALAIGQRDSALVYARHALRLASRDSIAALRGARAGEARLFEGRALLARGDTAAARDAIAAARAALVAGAGAAHPRAREASALLATLAP